MEEEKKYSGNGEPEFMSKTFGRKLTELSGTVILPRLIINLVIV